MQVEEVAVLKTELADFNTEFGEKESDYKLLQKQAETVADGAMMQDVTGTATKRLFVIRVSDCCCSQMGRDQGVGGQTRERSVGRN